MRYHNITYPDMNNGDGLRVVLWLSGCNHRCKGCQNPQTWDVDSGIVFDEKAKEELFRELDKDYISGLTLSGGDPLHKNNLDGVLNLVNQIRLLLPKKTIWIYSGYRIEDLSIWKSMGRYLDGSFSVEEAADNAYDNLIRQAIVENCDVLVDGRYIESQRDITLKWCGSSNQRVIDIQQSLKKGEIVLWDTN